MENLLEKLNSQGSTLQTESSFRMKARPIPSSSSKGKAFEDFGSSFGSTPWVGSQDKLRSVNRPQQTGKPTGGGKNVTGKHPYSTHGAMDSDSDDELDTISRRSPYSDSHPHRKKTKDDEVSINGKNYKYHSGYLPDPTLKGLKFNKMKKADGEVTKDFSSSQSKDAISKENGLSPAKYSANNGVTCKPNHIPKQTNSDGGRGPNNKPASGSHPLHEKSPNKRATPQLPSQQRKPKNPLDEVHERNEHAKPPRPKPRPLGARSTSSQLQLQPTSNNPSLNSAFGATTRIRKKGEPKPETCPIDRFSPVATGKTRKPDQFPAVSPLSSPAGHKAGFPMLSPLNSRTTTPVKANGKTTNGGGEGFPMPSPLSSQHADENERSKSETKPLRPDVSSLFSEDEGDPFKTRGGPAPFPMSSPLSKSSPIAPQAGPSRLGKRSSESKDSEDERERKKMREEDVLPAPLDSYDFDEEDSMFISPSTDPSTLCPYCDSSLPSFPTPLLTRLLSTTAKKSYHDPRPANPLGRKAPLAVFIGVCQRHRFESQTLPEAERKGWPKVIEWASLGERVQRMKEELQALIDDPGDELGSSDESEVEDDGGQGPRSKCVFWKEVMKEVKKKGSRAVAGVRGQFANFEKTQPGYYGELGSVIIHQTLYNIFPPASFDARTITPLTSNEFIQRILVPEVGARLIMEDKHLVGNNGMDMAVKILRESASYGVAMFPEDGGEWGDAGSSGGSGGKGGDEEMGVADLIVMERARQRRKELEEEERQDEEMWEREQAEKEKQQTVEKRLVAKAKGGPKGKEKAKGVRVSETELPKPRPRPKQIIKTKSVLTNDADTVIQPLRWEAQTKDLNTVAVSEVPATGARTKSRYPRRSPSTSQPKVEAEPADRVRKTRKPKKKTPNSGTDVDLDLCSSSDAVESSDAIKEASRPRRKGRAPDRAKTEEASDRGGSGMEMIEPLKTPAVRPNHHDRTHWVELREDEEELTPRPTRKGNTNSWVSSSQSPAAGASTSHFLPLVAARKKVRNREPEQRPRVRENEEPWMKSMAASPDALDEGDLFITPKSDSSFAGSSRPRPGKDTWLLSDESHSSAESQ